MGIDAAAAQRAADLLLPGWHNPDAALSTLPEALRPGTEAQAYAIQQLVMFHLGQIGGWKVGAANRDEDAAKSCAPMPLAHFHSDGAMLPSKVYTYRAIEAEIAFCLQQDLPARNAPYTRDDVLAAIGSAHVAIEILQSRYRDPQSPDRLSAMADLINHGGFVPGPKIADWQAIDWDREWAEVSVDGVSAIRRQGNPGGEMIRLIQWLADHGARWAGGLKAGQFVTTGSWTGKLQVPAGSAVSIGFSTAGSCAIRFSHAD